MAGQGASCFPACFETLLRDKYFLKLPPKTAGREQYGEKYVAFPAVASAKRDGKARRRGSHCYDLDGALDFGCFHRFVAPKAKIGELIVSGGGAHNPLLMAQTRIRTEGSSCARSLENLACRETRRKRLPLPCSRIETLHRRPANVPGATGAKKAVVLGKVCYAG